MARINKAGVKPIPRETYPISGSEVINHLQNLLGFEVDYDFTRWTGISKYDSYVRMRVVMNDKDCIKQDNENTWVTSVLKDNGCGIVFKKNVIDTITPFMYPDNIKNLRNNPEYVEEMQHLADIGLYGDNLDEVIRFQKLTHVNEADKCRVYLRPERIIYDMLADPTTNKIDGNMVITNVYGTTSDSIRWEVDVYENTSTNKSGDINIDRLFAK